MRLESVEPCKRSKSCESSGEEEQQEHENREQQPRKRSKSIPSCKPARLNNRGWALARALRARARPFELEATPSFLPADNRGWALARALRARARPFEVGASRSFLPAFLHPKRIRKTSKNVSKINPRRLEGFIKHLEKGHQKGVQNWSKCRPK